MVFTGPQRRQLQEALLEAFPSITDLAQMVAFELNENLAAIASGSNLSSVVFELVVWADARGTVKALIQAALSANPDNEQLRALAAQMGISVTPEPHALASAQALQPIFRVPYPRNPL